MKKVYLPYMQPRVHAQTKLMIENPPKGYEFVTANAGKMDRFINIVAENRLIKYLHRKFIKKRFHTRSIYDALYLSKVPEDVDLVLAWRPLDIRKPCIVEIMDNPFCMEGYDYWGFFKNKARIQKKLQMPSCKKIIVVNESSLRIMRQLFSERVLKKTVLIRAAVGPDNHSRSYNRKTTNILFLGSIANPDDFYIKGGLESLEAFKLISERFSNAHLTIRCRVPSEVKKRYSGLKNIKIIDWELSQDEIGALWTKTDILLSPGHQYALMSSLEAMSKGIPIVALDTWGVRDYLSDSYAFIITPSKKIKSYKEDSYPTNIRSESFIEEIKKGDPKVIANISVALEKLIQNPGLRRKMGTRARQVARKKFSLKTKNKRLKEIFDRATS